MERDSGPFPPLARSPAPLAPARTFRTPVGRAAQLAWGIEPPGGAAGDVRLWHVGKHAPAPHTWPVAGLGWG